MNTPVCVQCNNINTVNSTNNRLVTESCGHMKCMNCLMNEKSGCLACLAKNKTKEQDQSDDNNETTDSEETQPLNQLKLDNTVSPAKMPKKKICRTYPIKCSVDKCCKTFTSLSHFKYHMHVHRNNKCYICSICDTGFYAQSNLNRHMLKHTNERKFICQICKKSFNSGFTLKQHMNIHTGDKPHQCKICGKRFRDRSNYYKHVSNIHGANRPGRLSTQKKRFKCPHCDEMFRSARDTRRHSTVHFESKPFRCKLCTEKQFKRKDNLERHIRNYHHDYAMATDMDHEAKTHQTEKPKDIVNREKNILQNLNPLPPLSEEIIKKHLGDNDATKTVELDKSYILQANNARESVIVAQNKERIKKETSDPPIDYVHKIRKANLRDLNKRANKKDTEDIQLPPINVNKVMDLEKMKNKNIDVGSPPRNTEPYKMILMEERWIKMDN